MKEKKQIKPKKNVSQANLNRLIIVLLLVNILLSISMLTYGMYSKHENVENKISGIESKVNAIDGFFRSNVEGYDSGSENIQESETLESDSLKADISSDDDPFIGNSDAKVEVIEFSDYQCPFCRKYWTETYPQLKEDYIDTGKIKYVFRDFPLNFHAGAIPAAVAGNCIRDQLGNEKYFEYHDIVFSEQNKLGTGTIQFGEDEVMIWVGQITGLDMKKFNTCFSDPSQKAEVEADFEAGAKAGVSGTPSFFINGKLLVGAQPYSVIKAEIEKALNQ